ncbi:MAG TPA: DNA gyrase subunit A, partial [Anaerolineae bacterium]|nr:DNA gyrase subunit A [Anaerolineae bacterium]
DRAAAMRYTEARMSKLSAELLADIDKNTVDYKANFDDRESEPKVLPGRLPNLLLNGTSGIAVGMATNIPPHNLTELCGAILHLIDNQANPDVVTLDSLMQFVKGPDFPTGAQIVGLSGVRAAYATGRGKVIMRAKAEIGESRTGRQQITITEIPYQVNKANLVKHIAELVNKGVLSDIADLREESGREGIRIVVDLKRTAQPRAVLNQLYKHTALQSTFGIQMLALVNEQPRLLSLKRALQVYIDHRIEVTTRRIQFELDKALKRQHILEGLRIALANLDAVIATIRSADSADDARGKLMQRFELSRAQAQAILDMQLRRLAALEQQKIENEYRAITDQITEYQAILGDSQRVLTIIRAEVVEIREQYGDERRSEIIPSEFDFDIEDLVRDEDVLISITQRGYIKRTPVSAYRVQARGGKGLIGMTTRDEDSLESMFAAGSKSAILFFTNRGKAYTLKAYRIPEASRTARGTSVMNVLPLDQGEKVTAALPVTSFDDADYIVQVTRRGRIKRTALSAFANVRSTGIIAIGLDEGDELRWVKMTNGGQDVMLVSAKGQGIRFNEDDVRQMGRTAAGVMAIKLGKDDYLAGVGVVNHADDAEVDEETGELQTSADHQANLLIITKYGFGKRTPIRFYRQQNRYGSGVKAMVLKQAGDEIIGARIVGDDDELTLISTNGIILRTPVNTISMQGRSTRGVRVMRPKGDDSVASIAVIREGVFTSDDEVAGGDSAETGTAQLVEEGANN